MERRQNEKIWNKMNEEAKKNFQRLTAAWFLNFIFSILNWSENYNYDSHDRKNG